MTERLIQLKQFVVEDPNDPFNWYSLALEFLKTDQPQACSIFEKLVSQYPDYLPTYYPYAHLLIELQKPELAEKNFLQGIEIAGAKADAKTLKELKGAYQDWMYERE